MAFSVSKLSNPAFVWPSWLSGKSCFRPGLILRPVFVFLIAFVQIPNVAHARNSSRLPPGIFMNCAQPAVNAPPTHLVRFAVVGLPVNGT